MKQIKNIPEDTVIYRYINVLKFFDLLVKKQLYFSNYKYFSDKYETEITLKYIKEFARKVNSEIEDNKMSSFVNYFQNRCVNCWNISESEQYLLWKSYCQNINYGVVIKSTVKNLMSSLPDYSDIIFVCKKIKYIPYISPTNNINPIFTKYDFYQTEKELRVSCIIDYTEENERGIFIPVDLNILIDEIILNINSNYFQTVKKIVENILGIEFANQKIKKSLIMDDSLKQ